MYCSQVVVSAGRNVMVGSVYGQKARTNPGVYKPCNGTSHSSGLLLVYTVGSHLFEPPPKVISYCTLNGKCSALYTNCIVSVV